MCCHCVNRREFLQLSALGAGAALTGAMSGSVVAAETWPSNWWDPAKPFLNIGRPLRVQPVLMCRLFTPREMSSWKSWGGIQTEAAVAEEVTRISSELQALAQRAEFPVEFLPVAKVTNADEAMQTRASGADATIVYPSTGSRDVLDACIPDSGAVIFVRHRSGPVYYFYESLSTRILNKTGERDASKRASVNDVVVDDPDELLWRLRALYGLRNFVGSRIVALGGVQGKYDDRAPGFARERYKLDIVDYSYDDLGKRIQTAMADPAKLQCAEQWASAYLALPGTTLDTERSFVVNAFVLYGLFKEVLEEHEARAFTINSCMSTIMPMSKTTACLPLGLLNDEGYVAFCESDFVIVPAGMLLRHIASKPIFMHNSTFPHDGLVTCAHCTSPRRLDATKYEPTRVVTHYESEYGAAPKVDMPLGQEVSFINPEYASGRWVGLKGVVENNPFYDICRSQQEVRVAGNWRRLLDEVRDSHWMMVYGDYLREAGYAAQRLGLTWDNISEA